MTRPLRADARRNYDRLLVAAREAVMREGAEVSLDDIAKRAGVGSGTLYRHFPNRQALLETVFKDQIQQLYERGEALLAAGHEPGAALEDWLHAFQTYLVSYRGLAVTLQGLYTHTDELFTESHAQLRHAVDTLLERAQAAGVIRAGVTGSDLLRLISGIALATEVGPADEQRVDRLFAVVMDGLRAI
jgi:AcrR family transcriptional regulator